MSNRMTGRIANSQAVRTPLLSGRSYEKVDRQFPKNILSCRAGHRVLFEFSKNENNQSYNLHKKICRPHRSIC
uniref:Uncharacterized protein n=1 Tax=Romanomermis culicivorax TaxID=13658 RepID=A0A915L7L4_ROMCU